MRVLVYLLIFPTVVPLLDSSTNWVSASASYDEEGAEENVDVADLDFVEELAPVPSLAELAKQEQDQQKKNDMQDDGQFDADDEQVENPVDTQSSDLASASTPEEVDFVDSPDELEEGEEYKQEETPEESADVAAGADVSEGHIKYGGHIVETQDEEGIVLDTSSLDRPEERTASTITEFVDAELKFTKEKEEKKKRKERAKLFRQQNNEVDIYNAEITAFREAQKKNKARFKDDVENAEMELQAPQKPSRFKNLKVWFNKKMDDLIEKYGSDISD